MKEKMALIASGEDSLVMQSSEEETTCTTMLLPVSPEGLEVATSLAVQRPPHLDFFLVRRSGWIQLRGDS